MSRQAEAFLFPLAGQMGPGYSLTPSEGSDFARAYLPAFEGRLRFTVVRLAAGNYALAWASTHEQLPLPFPDGLVLGKIAESEKYAPLNVAALDGSQIAAGILYGSVTPSDADQDVKAILRDCNFQADRLAWPTGTDEQKTAAIAQLATLGIACR